MNKPRVNESNIEKYFVWTVERMGGTAYKFRSPNHRGVSDRIACLPDGTVWFVELKASGGRLAPLQELFAARMRALKQNYITLWTKTEIDEWQRTITSSSPTRLMGLPPEWDACAPTATPSSRKRQPK